MDAKAILIALLIACLWGIKPVIQKHVLATLQPETVLVLSALLYGSTIAVYAIYNNKIIIKDYPKMTKQHIMWLAIAAILCGATGTILYYQLLNIHPSYKVTAITFCSPAFTLILAYFLLKENVTKECVLGVILIVIGIVLLGRPKSIEKLKN